jgi:hypothetical protein
MENILNTEQGRGLRTHYLTLKGGGYDLSKPALVKNGKEVRFGYDYSKQNVPYNYGKGVYLRSNPYIIPRQVQPIRFNR